MRPLGVPEVLKMSTDQSRTHKPMDYAICGRHCVKGLGKVTLYTWVDMTFAEPPRWFRRDVQLCSIWRPRRLAESPLRETLREADTWGLSHI